MAKARRNGTTTSKRPNIASILFKIAIKRWVDEEWSIRYSLHPNRTNARILATADFNTRIVEVYPHSIGLSIAKTGLHEICHVGFDLDADREPETYALEEWIWKRLTKKEKQQLVEIFEQNLNSRS